MSVKPTVTTVARKSWLAAIIIATSVAATAGAQQAKRPTAAERAAAAYTTAERMIVERNMQCVPGKARFSADSQGRLVITISKVCTEVSR